LNTCSSWEYFNSYRNCKHQYHHPIQNFLYHFITHKNLQS